MKLNAARILSWLHGSLRWVLYIPVLAAFTVIVLSLHYWGLAGETIEKSEIGQSLGAYDEPIELSVVEKTISHALFGRDDAPEETLCVPVLGLLSFGRKSAGPSTDLARQIFLKRARPRTFHTMVEQLFTACRLEAKLNHDLLLREWLSRAYLGNGEFGIEAAAHSYFGVEPGELSEDDGYALAALLWGPWLRKHPDKWLEKQEMFKRRAMEATK